EPEAVDEGAVAVVVQHAGTNGARHQLARLEGIAPHQLVDVAAGGIARVPTVVPLGQRVDPPTLKTKRLPAVPFLAGHVVAPRLPVREREVINDVPVVLVDRGDSR